MPEGETAARARRPVAAGPHTSFTGLHPSVRWDEDLLVVNPTSKAATEVDLAGRGLLLVPAIFAWPKVWPRSDPPWDPALVYPAANIAEVRATTDLADFQGCCVLAM